MTDLRPFGPARSGELLDRRYRLDEMVGEGGMGSVWRAHDDALCRTVAVKIFTAGTTEDSDAVRRESEKRLLASVSHPSLVTLFDAHLSRDGRSYLVMEYIEGGTLASVLTRGPATARDAASVAADLGEALHVIHEAGIIHRDVKPANILLRPPLAPEHTFRAILADFGIAHLVDTARVTTPGMAVGTAAYISPEQVRGHAPTPASDVYSLGLVLIETLSGRRAFPQQNPIEAVSVRLSMPPEVAGDWGYGWRALLTAMTAVDPKDRPSALEVSARGRTLDADGTDPEETELVEKGEPAPGRATDMHAAADPRTKIFALPTSDSTGLIESTRETPSADFHPPTRRRRGVVIGAIALALVAVAVAFAVWINTSSITQPPSPPPQLPQLEEPLHSHLQDLLDRVSP